MTEKEAFDKYIQFCDDKPPEVLACIGTAIEALSAYRNMESFRNLVDKAYAERKTEDPYGDSYSDTWNEINELLCSYAQWNLEVERRLLRIREMESEK